MFVRSSVLGLLSCVTLLGCPSKEGEQRDANAGNAPPPSVPSGPLANLESSPFINEVWNSPNERMHMLYYPRENVRVSGPCRSPNGQLQCAAMQQLRGGTPVEIPGRELDGAASAGVKACMRLKLQLVSANNQVGDEESFCRFTDGSLLSTGSLEQYGIKILQ
jgi:hypothetical protein